ncbi:hypothetical protein, unknown function [Leishmania tarentolae]|uniref:C2 domain-containing protein n=1 Tax=Leishmania tarentolae TaxID=5689 RepID=A0A640KKJ8_LEITA|nr:hypothetical protein, unknown function [Leishmania tarentolae]
MWVSGCALLHIVEHMQAQALRFPLYTHLLRLGDQNTHTHTHTHTVAVFSLPVRLPSPTPPPSPVPLFLVPLVCFITSSPPLRSPSVTMPVVDVSVLSATEITGVTLRNSFCAYVRLQGQAVRTRSSRADRAGEVCFSDKFCFQYHYDAKRSGRNRLFVELWSKKLFSQSCVSVAWLEMAETRFVRGEQMRVSLRGAFEGTRATLTIVVTPLDFGEIPRVVQQVMPATGSVPMEGIPLAMSNPYTSSAYMPNAGASALDSASCKKCEGPMPPPPQPQAFVGASLPPPLYPVLPQGIQHQSSEGNQYCNAVSMPAQASECDHSMGHVKPKPL